MAGNAEQHGSVTTIRVLSDSGQVTRAFLTSDVHIDSVSCNRKWFQDDCERAMSLGAGIFLFGDTFDAMQGRFDPRRSMDELRPEYRRPDYYDYIVQDVARILSPFVKGIVLITPGNHETATLKNANTFLSDRLVATLNTQYGGHVLHGAYGGWVRWMFEHTAGGCRTSVKLKYHHGFGGEAPVTKGVIQTARQAVYLPDADVVVNGHSHNSYVVPIARERLSDSGRVYADNQLHLRTPGYKQEYGDGSYGWSVERGSPPKSIGGAMLEMTYRRVKKGVFIETQAYPIIHAAEPIPLSPMPISAVEYPQDNGIVL